ncbi:MAG: hypothetical protein ACOY4K_13115 [Pseudomonadota bacterium]
MSAVEDLNAIGGEGAATVLVGAIGSVTRPYDPAKDQEVIRGRVALLLVVALLMLVGTLMLVSLAAGQACWREPSSCAAVKDSMEAVKLIIDAGLSAVVGLVGAVTGFYFGSKAASQKPT